MVPKLRTKLSFQTDMNFFIMENMDCTKVGTESSTENTPNTPEFICTICLQKPKSSKKASLGVRTPLRVLFSTVNQNALTPLEIDFDI